jgi:hypothetical protein
VTVARRRAVAALVVLLVAAAVAGALLLQRDEPEQRRGIDIPAGRERATAACAAADDVFRIVAEDGPAPDVLAAAEATQRESARAREHDPLWSTLASGADALLQGLRKDDGRAAGLGRRIVDLQCARLRNPEPQDAG